jgi:hypothetical protein
MSDNVPVAANPVERRKKTIRFVVLMAAVLGTFVFLSILEGPPAMPRDSDHVGVVDDRQCMRECHDWQENVDKGAPKVKSPMGAKHPAPRYKKGSRFDAGAGVNVEAPPVCLKCHGGFRPPRARDGGPEVGTVEPATQPARGPPGQAQTQPTGD